MTAAEAHPATHVLADLAGDVLDARRSAEVRAHVDQCDRCQETIERLTLVTATLREAPAEVRMPELVAARIGAALAAEQAGGVRSEPRLTSHGSHASSAVADDTADGDGGTVAWFRRKLPATLAAAASVSVIGLAGYVAVTAGDGDSGGGSDNAEVAAGAANDSAEDSAPEAAPGQRRMSPGAPGDAPSAQHQQETLPDDAGAALSSAVVEVWETRDEVLDGCGQNLADELSQDLIGSRNEGSGVLVVLDTGDGTLDGWQVTTCGSGTGDTISGPVEVPIPE